MKATTFLDLVRLPAFEGLTLAATATRAFERYGDLFDGQQKPALLREDQRFDIMDECMDLVAVLADRPSGFEFTGLSLADFWAALLATNGMGTGLDQWRTTLNGPEIAVLREAARKRVQVHPSPDCHMLSRGVFLPRFFQDLPLVELPEPLVRLQQAANPDWIKPRRSRYTVEVSMEAGIPNSELVTRGRCYPQPSRDGKLTWLGWENIRLQPQRGDEEVEYFELQLTLPSLEESFFSSHFSVRNLFAHIRVTHFVDENGRDVLLLDELQSDWLRDRRYQERGKPLSARRPIQGAGCHAGDMPPIPECPVAAHWLDLALQVFIDFADELNCTELAWTPGRIQSELHPGLPLEVAQALYDRDVPNTLKCLLGYTIGEITVDYPTYQRNVLKRFREGQGWYLTKPDGVTPVSEPVQGRDTVFGLYRVQAIPTVETLPALDLFRHRQGGNAMSVDEAYAPGADPEDDEPPGHGGHWGTLYDPDHLEDILVRNMQESCLVDEHPCRDVYDGSERTETVYCLRWGDNRIAHDVLVVSDSVENRRALFSSYPVLLDGVRHIVELDRFVAWEYGIEAWAHGRVTQESIPLCFFDTRYYAGSGAYQPGQRLEVSLAGLAYFLRPIQTRSFEIKEGALWELEKQRRLSEGESEEEAAQPVKVHMTGSSIFLPVDNKNAPDEAQFQGVIEAIDQFEHDGRKIYRLEMVVVRPGDEEFRLPIFASEHVLDGYVPRLGEDVEGILWLQGRILGLADSGADSKPGQSWEGRLKN